MEKEDCFAISYAFETVSELFVPFLALPESSSLLEPEVRFRISLDCPSSSFDVGTSRLDELDN